MDDEDATIVEAMKKAIEATYESVCDELGIDGAFYDLDATVWLRNEDLEIYDKVNIIKAEQGRCAYCGKPTNMYIRTFGYICPQCHGAMLNGVFLAEQYKNAVMPEGDETKTTYQIEEKEDGFVVRQMLGDAVMGQIYLPRKSAGKMKQMLHDLMEMIE